MKRPMNFTHQLVVRVDDEMWEWLQADADYYGRTVAQSVRWHMKRVIADEI